MGTYEEDKQILRRLASEYAEIASLPIQKTKIQMWKNLNELKPGRPLIWIKGIPWFEMNVDDELTLRTSDSFLRRIETKIRQDLYQWKHMPGDMVLEPVVLCPMAIYDTGFGIHEDVAIATTDENSDVVSRHFHIQIKDEEDLEKIKTPQISHDEQETRNRYECLLDIFDGIIEVQKQGIDRFWCAPWDELVRYWGTEELFMDMAVRPELVHKAIIRFIAAHQAKLDQLESLNLVSLNNKNGDFDSGGLGYTDQLPQPDYDPAHVRLKDCWAGATAQIFSSVSAKMHEEFALQYEAQYLGRFGLAYYGCCDPLHRKTHMLKGIPNLRKVSMSAWINVDEAVANLGNKYVFSYKPNPSVLATDSWNTNEARSELENVFSKAKVHNCIVEATMKDISTVRYQPQRLWEWSRMALKLAEQFS
jgi:hypothetical protein